MTFAIRVYQKYTAPHAEKYIRSLKSPRCGRGVGVGKEKSSEREGGSKEAYD